MVLVTFGKYREKNFDFGSFTLFYGPNESGKTTVFDALFQGLCRPKKSRKSGRLLADRYGEERRVELVFDGETLEVTEEEFLNLYAIRAGGLSLSISSRSSWMEKLKANLFTGGIDPTRMKDEFAKRASDIGSYSHNRRISALERRDRELEAEQTDLMRRRKELLSREREIQKGEIHLRTLTSRRSDAAGTIDRLRKELARERKIEARSRLTDILLKLDEGRSRREWLERLTPFRRTDIGQLDEIQAKERVLQQTWLKRQTRWEAGQREYERREGIVARLRPALKGQKILSDVASELLPRIEERRHGRRRQAKSPWGLPVLIVSLVVLAAGLSFSFFPVSPFLRLAGLLVGVVSAVGGSLFYRSAMRRLGGQDTLIAQMKDEWRNRTGRELRSASIEGLEGELDNIGTDRRQLAERLSEEEEGLSDVRLACSRMEREREAAKRSWEAAKAERLGWLGKRGVASRDEYVQRTAQYGTLSNEQIRWEKELARELRSRNIDSEEELRSQCERRLKELEREGIPKLGKGESRRMELEREIQRLEGDSVGLSEQVASLTAGQAGEMGELRGALGDIPERIEQLAAEKHDVQRELEAHRLDKLAASEVSGIFGEISGDSSENLSSLAEEIENTFSGLVAQRREIELLELDLEGFTIADHGGERRTLPLLSTGTRDAFLLAVRLALAARSRAGPGVIVLDEPFHNLDRSRTEFALEVLKEFQREKHWQVILFTKEEETVTRARELFPDMKLYALSWTPR
jgi:DNA sulfur modification protein DndD